MTTRRWLLTLMVATVSLLSLGGGVLAVDGGEEAEAPTGVAAAQDAPEGARRALVVSLPRMAWSDLDDGTPPSLAALLRASAVGSMSPRTIGPTTSLGEGYATIGAGNRATVASRRGLQLQPWLPDGDAGLAFGVQERFSGEPAGAVFTRRTGLEAAWATVVHLGMPSLAAANDRLLYGTIPGSLGTSLREAGLEAAVVGNADLGEGVDGGVVFQREVALTAVDEAGRSGGRVDEGLLVHDPEAPFGLRLDHAATLEAFNRAWQSHAAVVVEASDLERADAFRAVADADAAATAKRVALERFDRLLGDVLRAVDLERDLVIVVSPAPPRGRTELLIAAMAGPDVDPGALRSATTRRAGYVTLADVAPTVLHAFGVEPPASMTGALMSSAGGSAFGPGVVEGFVEDNERAIFRDSVTGPVTAAFIVFQVFVYALAAIAFTRHRPSLLQAAGGMSLMVLAFPPLAFLSGLVPFHRVSAVAYVVLLFAGAGLFAFAAGRLGSFDPQAPPMLLLGLSLVVLLSDIVVGGRLQLNTVFGYSPIVAGRFAGFGNLASSLITVTTILFVTGAWGMAARRDRSRDSERRVVVGGGVLFVVGLAIIGLPAFGSDVGGVLTNAPAFTAVLLLLAGVRIGWRRSVGIGAATVALLALFAVIDLARPAEVRTHLGRLVSRTLDGGAGGLLVTIERKAAANVSILTSSLWTYAIPVALAFLAFLVWRPQGFLRGVIERFAGVRAGLIGVLVGGVLGFGLNDSGVAIPAMMLAVLLPYLAWLVARTSAGRAPAARTPEGTPHGAGT